MGNTFPRDIILEVSKKIVAIYSENESYSIASLLVERIFELTTTQLILNEQVEISKEKSRCLEQSIARLLINEPIQHILGEAEFYGRKFQVNRDVLIPRQETEELIKLIVDDNELESPRILDIGTGSGCIACSLALEISSAQVQAIDISEEALITAQRNADLLHVEVSLLKIDIFKDSIPLKEFDIIVSNPPYVLVSERELMHKNVVDYDPQLALFVPDSEPLLFYNRIADTARNSLKSGGQLYFEINEKFGVEVGQSLTKVGYQQVKIHQDLNGKDRFVSGLI